MTVDINYGREISVGRNLGFEKTNHLIFCPLCKELVYAVRIIAMSWDYERCPNCLIAFESQDWIHAYKMILLNKSK